MSNKAIIKYNMSYQKIDYVANKMITKNIKNLKHKNCLHTL